MCNVLKVMQDAQLSKELDELFSTYFVNVIMLPDAKNETEAIEIAQQYEPEILLLDLNLTNSHTDGIVKKLKRLHPNLRCIMFDEEENFQNIQQALRMGAIDYLVKPFLEEEALTSIHRAIISLNQVSLLEYHVDNIKVTKNEMILPMVEYIHEHYHKEMNLDTLANYMHLNKTYLCQVFKKEIGMTYLAYLTQYRVEQAKKLLRETTYSLADISEAVGYVDPAYFSRIFKKQTQMSPNQYRQTYKGDHISTTYVGNV